MEHSDLTYIQLSNIKEEHLLGTWCVKIKSSKKDATYHPFIIYDCIVFNKNGTYLAKNGSEINGEWKLFLEDQIIYSPQITFYKQDKKIANSIITQLMTCDKTFFKLVLYFNTGLELILEKGD